MVSLAVAAVAAACSPRPAATTSSGVPLAGPLIPATTTIVTAWDVPRNPMADASLANSPEGRSVQWGYRLFTNTPAEVKRFAPGRMACAHCHLNAGQRERALPLVAVASVFPEQNVRAGRLYTLNDRIVDCFLRSENATGAGGDAAQLPETTSKEVEAIAAYVTWLGRDVKTGKNPPEHDSAGRGHSG
jgi:thiosulfate dehydrogenase